MTETGLQPRTSQTWNVSKIKVLLMYIVYPLAMATYFKKAFQHREDVDLKVCGPYTASWIPWLGGMTVLDKYAIPPDLPLPFHPGIGEINYELVKANLPAEWVPDLVIQVDAGLHFKYKPTEGMVVTIGTDPHVLNEWYDVPRSYSDKFFNMQAIYSKPGDLYLPYAYSRYDHYPVDISNPDDKVDAVLVGMPYLNRVQWIDELRQRGASVIFENGPIFDEARELYARGAVGLNWSSLEDLNARAFELPAMGLYPVMNRVPDMNKFPFFEHCGLFENTLEDAIEKTMWAVQHKEEARFKTAVIRQSLIDSLNSYDDRVQSILEACGYV